MLLNNFTLLYVEDNHDAQDYMKFYLGDEVKEFYQAFDGEEGLKMYHDKKPDIILTDINMPNMNGLDMSVKIKNIDEHQYVIILSAFQDTETLKVAINTGVDGFILKPLDTSNILLNKLNFIAENLQNKIDAANYRSRMELALFKYKQQVELLKELQTKLEKQKNLLHHKAHHDGLTEVANQVSFNAKLNETIQNAKNNDKKVALFFIDLDNFKDINDTLGHHVGDETLKIVAQKLTQTTRDMDIVARLGGDEFGVIIENIKSLEDVQLLASKIIKIISSPMKIDTNLTTISCSIGIGIYPDNAQDDISLLKYADKAMYRAKRSGKNRYQ